jgi:hypothetical protein
LRGEAVARKSPQEVTREVQRRLEEIEHLREQAQQQGLAFSSPTEEQLTRKIKAETGRSPYIYAQAWTSAATPGSAASYYVYAANSDPLAYFPVYVTIFFGLANFFDDLAEALDARDRRWPYVSSARTYLAAGTAMNTVFNFTTPTGIAFGTYLGNSILWRGEWHDQGTYFDRGLFDVALS